MKKRTMMLNLRFNGAKIRLFLIFFLFAVILHSSAAINTSGRNAYDGIIQEVAYRYNVPAKLIHSIILVESNYDPYAVSKKGAVGLMQLMPATAREYGVEDRYDPRQNIEGGVKYLKYLMKLFNDKTDLVLAAYNAGQEAIKEYDGIPPYNETINYVKKVTANYNKAYISTRTQIFKFRTESGKIVLTNNPNYVIRKENK
jgi:soluble lytic murein transglycosylase-like protein